VILYAKRDETDMDVGRLNILSTIIDITVPAAHTFDATYLLWRKQ
jgi:hypothetical protein